MNRSNFFLSQLNRLSDIKSDLLNVEILFVEFVMGLPLISS